MKAYNTASLELREAWYSFAKNVRRSEAKLAWAPPIRNVLPWALKPLWGDIEKWGPGIISSFTFYKEYGWMEITFPETSRKYFIGFEIDSTDKVLFWNKSSIARRHLTQLWEEKNHPPLKIKFAPGSPETNPRLWTEYYFRTCNILCVKPWNQFLCYRFATSAQKAHLLGLDPIHPASQIVWGATDPISGEIVSDLYFDPHEIVHVVAKGLEGWPDPLLAEGLAETFKRPHGIESFVLDRWFPLKLALRMLSNKRITIPSLRIQMSLFIRYLLHEKGTSAFHTFYMHALPVNISEAAYFAYGSHLDELDEKAKIWIKTYGLKEVIREFDLT